jgi:hypothetical protein
MTGRIEGVIIPASSFLCESFRRSHCSAIRKAVFDASVAERSVAAEAAIIATQSIRFSLTIRPEI